MHKISDTMNSKKNKDHGLDLVYKRRDEGKLDGYIDALDTSYINLMVKGYK